MKQISDCFSNFLLPDNINDAWHKWYKIFTECCNVFAPLKCIKVKNTPINFITPGLRDQMYMRFYLHKKSVQSNCPRLWNEYKSQRNKVNSLIRQAKEDFFISSVKEANGNQKYMWRTLRAALNNNKYNSDIPVALTPDCLNNFFTTVGSQLAKILPLKYSMPDFIGEAIHNCFNFSSIEEETVLHELKLLRENSNLDILDIDSRLLFLSAPIIAPTLTKLFNMSLTSGTVPVDWKKARVTPIFKGKGNRDDCTDYRPISIISHVAKLLEKMVKSQVVHYLDLNNIISPHQSAFLKNHSTRTALHNMVDDWLSAMNDGHLSIAVCLDLSKCFDTISHNILLYKLCKYGFNEIVIKWMRSYLTDRTQCVKINSDMSEFKQISLGIPQGSVLGPILFLLFINDLPHIIHNCHICMFADDITLYFSGKNFNHIQSVLQTDLNNVLKWLDENRLFVNANKSNVIVFGTPQQAKNRICNITINNSVLQQVDNIKLLGIYIDTNLCWKYHTDNLLKKLASKVGVICRLSKILPFHLLNTVYLTIFQPYLDYCLTVWGSSQMINIEPLQRLQNRAARSVTHNYSYDIHGIDIVRNLKWMNIKERYQYLLGTLMYKCVNKTAPSYLVDRFQTIQDVHTLNTRSAINNKLYLPHPNLSLYKKSISYNGAMLWNNIPDNITSSGSVDCFKLYFKNYIISQV